MLDGTADAGTIAADDDAIGDEEQQLYAYSTPAATASRRLPMPDSYMSTTGR